MRDKCDIFLQGLEITLMEKVTNMITSMKNEMYAEINKNVSFIMKQHISVSEDAPMDLSQTSNDSSITPSVSDKYNSTVINDAEGDFSLPKRQQKRIKIHENRLKWSQVNTSFKDPVTGFSGKPPDAFIYKCSRDTQPDSIKNHLIKNGVKVKSVDLLSHRDAANRSFKVSVQSVDDYDMLLSRKFIPKYVKVTRFFPHKDYFANKSRNSAPIVPLCVDDPLPVVDSECHSQSLISETKLTNDITYSVKRDNVEFI